MDENSRAQWRTASYSGSNGGACIEVAARRDGSGVLVRDNKNRQGPVLRFTPGAWKRFAEQVRSGAC
jgi:Domain of unknown function (DUF397)